MLIQALKIGTEHINIEFGTESARGLKKKVFGITQTGLLQFRHYKNNQIQMNIKLAMNQS